MMKCNVCRVKMKRREATVQAPYIYNLSGLKNVFLAGIDVYECRKCSTQSPMIPRIDELHQVILRDILRKPSLTGEEIRFLRKNVGLSAIRLAKLLGITPETLSRAENDRQILGAQTDRSLRTLVTSIAMGGEATREIVLEMADGILKAKQVRRPPVFNLQGNHWKIAA